MFKLHMAGETLQVREAAALSAALSISSIEHVPSSFIRSAMHRLQSGGKSAELQSKSSPNGCAWEMTCGQIRGSARMELLTLLPVHRECALHAPSVLLCVGNREGRRTRSLGGISLARRHLQKKPGKKKCALSLIPRRTFNMQKTKVCCCRRAKSSEPASASATDDSCFSTSVECLKDGIRHCEPWCWTPSRSWTYVRVVTSASTNANLRCQGSLWPIFLCGALIHTLIHPLGLLVWSSRSGWREQMFKCSRSLAMM